ncbi:MAG: restriction endonuclease subunit S, partial [Thermoleophilia bacterium]
MVKELKFKQTEIGKIPKEWKILKIGNILSLEYGKGLIAKHRRGNKYPVYGSNSIIGYNCDYLINGPGIIVGRKGTIGSVGWSDMDYWPIDTTYYIKLKGTEIDLKWLSNKLLTLGLSKLNMATGTPGLNRDLVYNLNISIPPFQEQKKIAEILSTMDHSIEEVDESINKTERLKKGLMQGLFTKGIGYKEFKETEIGKIPKEWKAVKLGDESIIEIRSNKTINGFDKVAFIPMEAISDFNIFAKFEIRSAKDVKSYTYCESGDILLAKITPSLENGKQGIVPEDIPKGFALATTEVFPIC